MTKMNNIFEQYALLDMEMKALELKKGELRADVLKEIVANGCEAVETAFGKFSYSPTKKWKYPAKLVEMAEELKGLEAKAQSTGDATCVETESFRFVSNKI